MGRPTALAVAIATSLLAVCGAGGAPTPVEPERGGTVVFGPMQEPSCLNPVNAICLDLPGSSIFDSVLEPAFAIAPDFSARPQLVSGVTFTTQPPFTLTYHIRRNARWSDGVPVTAGDFVFTHNAVVEQLPADQLGPNADVASVRALDPKTVRVVMRARRADWRNLFGSILPRHALVGADVGDIWSDQIIDPRT